MEKRKLAKDYRREYQDLLDKTKALESRIRNRLKQMCKNHPNAILGTTTNPKVPFLAKNYPEKLIMNANIFTIIKLIEKIEYYNEKQNSCVQTSMYDNELF